MVEEIMMFFIARKINVSGIADVPLTSRLRSADVDADSDADVVISGSPASPLFFIGGYVNIPLINKAHKMANFDCYENN
uniref:VCBS repeat-containing protein n=1 Tax=Bellilinea caldifistulae TaxID=360411 RepID=A0A7C4L0P9_9CHLR